MGTHRNLRSFFRRTGTRQVDFAKRIGVTQAHLSRVLSGKRVPSLDLALRIAAAANIPVSSLGVERSA